MTEGVFFDLDGTLTDPKAGIVRSIRYAMDRLDLPSPGDDELARYIGPPLLDSLGTLVGIELARDALRHYRERFSDVGWKENVPYAGVISVLEQLADSGMDLYVATSKPFVFADRIIRHFRMDSYFKRVFGSELDGTRSSKGELLRFALSETGFPRGATMIGDREHDVLGAKSNRMRSIGVTYGYGTRDELQNAGADAIADRPDQLVSEFLGSADPVLHTSIKES